MEQCTGAELPYALDASGTLVHHAETPGQVCANWAAGNYAAGYRPLGSDSSHCLIGNTAGTAAVTFPVVQVCEDADPHFSMEAQQGLTAGRVDDYIELWMAFVGFCVVVLVLKSLYSRFRIDSST